MRIPRQLFFVLFIGLTKFSLGQKVRLEGDVSQFVCAADSIEHFTIRDLKDSGVDSIMTCLYDYDNGRVSRAVHYILWTKSGKEKIRVIRGCDCITVKDSLLSGQVTALFRFYTTKKVDEAEGYLPSRSSHDMGYSVKNYLSTKKYSRFRVKDDVRHFNDPKVAFVNEFDKLIVSMFP